MLATISQDVRLLGADLARWTAQLVPQQAEVAWWTERTCLAVHAALSTREVLMAYQQFRRRSAPWLHTDQLLALDSLLDDPRWNRAELNDLRMGLRLHLPRTVAWERAA